MANETNGIFIKRGRIVLRSVIIGEVVVAQLVER